MEWCCAKCGLAATADDWSLLLSMGWRIVAGGEMRCVLCVRKEPERFHSGARVVPLDAARERRGRRETV
jgi:hypothetical protein